MPGQEPLARTTSGRRQRSIRASCASSHGTRPRQSTSLRCVGGQICGCWCDCRVLAAAVELQVQGLCRCSGLGFGHRGSGFLFREPWSCKNACPLALDPIDDAPVPARIFPHA
eukprot:232405-Chlamydomonas_euryale.AAC.3